MYKTLPEFYFIFVGNMDIYDTLRHGAQSILYPTKFHSFHNFIFFGSSNTFFINNAQKFKYQPNRLKLI